MTIPQMVASRSTGYGPRGPINKVADLHFVGSVFDLPPAVAGVITLPAMTSWEITNEIDLLGSRIVCDGIVAMRGASPETCILKSTGLGAGQALLYSESSLTLRDMALNAGAGRIAVEVDSDGSAAIDWTGVNFTGQAIAIKLTDVDNAILELMTFWGDGIHVFGGINTLGVSDSIFVAGDGHNAVMVDQGATIARRLRVDHCAVVAVGTGTGFDVPAASINASEGFILDFINFSGGGQYVIGSTVLDDTSRWVECRGIANTTRLGEMFASSNTSPTTIITAGAYEKANIATVAGPYNQRFTHTTNRLTYASELIQTFTLQVVMSVLASNGTEIGLRARVNGVDVSTDEAKSTIRSNNKAEGFAYQATAQLALGDYVEIFVTNHSNTTDITVESMNVQIRKA